MDSEQEQERYLCFISRMLGFQAQRKLTAKVELNKVGLTWWKGELVACWKLVGGDAAVC